MKIKNLIIFAIGFHKLINFEIEDNLIVNGFKTKENFEEYKKQLNIKEQFIKLRNENKLKIATKDKKEEIKRSIYEIIFIELQNIEPKDVINVNNIPCFKIDKINIKDILESPIEMYIDIPNSLKEDSYEYFGLILNSKYESHRYRKDDIIIIRKGESFAFEHTDELLVLRNKELIFSRFTHQFEEHNNILYIQDMDEEEYEIRPEDMYIYKIIGTVVGILPRIQQDKNEKDEGIFERRLKSLYDWKEYNE